MSNPIKQHYVPQTYLKHFCDETGYFFSYTTKANKIIRQAPKSTGYEKNFYTLDKNEDHQYAIEIMLAEHLDNLYNPIIHKIEHKDQLDSIDLYNLSLFIAFQYLRTPYQRENYDGLIKEMHIKHAEMNFYFKKNSGLLSDMSQKDIDKLDDIFKNNSLDVTVPKDHSIKFMLNFSEKMALMLMKHDFLIIQAPSKGQFITTDNPYCMIKESWSGNWSGLGIINTVKLFPLTPKLLLILRTPKIIENGGGHVFYFKESRSGVREYNKVISSWAHNFIYCKNKELLQNITNSYSK